MSFDDCISAETGCYINILWYFCLFFCTVMLPIFLEWRIHQTAHYLKPWDLNIPVGAFGVNVLNCPLLLSLRKDSMPPHVACFCCCLFSVQIFVANQCELWPCLHLIIKGGSVSGKSWSSSNESSQVCWCGKSGSIFASISTSSCLQASSSSGEKPHSKASASSSRCADVELMVHAHYG